MNIFDEIDEKNIKNVKKYIKEYPDKINKQNSSGETPLIYVTALISSMLNGEYEEEEGDEEDIRKYKQILNLFCF